jgi:hypothetical protein
VGKRVVVRELEKRGRESKVVVVRSGKEVGGKRG